jgi:hypothetical protein
MNRARAEDAPAYRMLHAREVAAEAELNKVLTIYTPRHPLVREKLSALSRAEREAAEYLR